MSDVYARKHARLGGSGGMLPQEILEIKCSEIGIIFGRKQSRSSYYLIQFLALLHMPDIVIYLHTYLRP